MRIERPELQSSPLMSRTVAAVQYIDPQVLRRVLDAQVGPQEWSYEYEWFEEGVYACTLTIMGVKRQAIVDLNLIPGIKDTAIEKFDYVLAKAAEAFGFATIESATVAALVEEAPAETSKETPAEETSKEAEEKTEVDRNPITPEEVNAALRTALHTFQGAEERWNMRRQKGLTNADLKAAISDEFGQSSGGSEGRLQFDVRGTGCSVPSFIYKVIGNENSKKTEKGAPLTAHVRELLAIPVPEPVEVENDVFSDKALAEQKETPAEQTKKESPAPEEAQEYGEEDVTAMMDSADEMLGEMAGGPAPEEQAIEEDPDDVFALMGAETSGAMPAGYQEFTPPVADPLLAEVEAAMEVPAVADPPAVVESTPEAAPEVTPEVQTEGVICACCGKVVPPTLVEKALRFNQPPMHPVCILKNKQQNG